MSEFGTTVSGRLAPTAEIAAPTGKTAASGSVYSGRVTLTHHTVSKAGVDSNRRAHETPYAGGYLPETPYAGVICPGYLPETP